MAPSLNLLNAINNLLELHHSQAQSSEQKDQAFLNLLSRPTYSAPPNGLNKSASVEKANPTMKKTSIPVSS